MSLELTGKLIKILPEQTGEGKNGTWVKSSFVIETQDQYPKNICFDAWGERVETVKNLKEGTMLKVGFDVESREYNERWYTNAKAWKIETVSEGGSTPPPDMPPPEYKETDIPASEEGDDLPF